MHERKIDCTLTPEDVSIRRLVLQIAQSLVDEKVSITVDVLNINGIRTLRVLADAGGLGPLIGKQGRTVRAMRTILSAYSTKMKQVYALDIQEADAGFTEANK